MKNDDEIVDKKTGLVIGTHYQQANQLILNNLMTKIISIIINQLINNSI